jgi:hypothetical protein
MLYLPLYFDGGAAMALLSEDTPVVNVQVSGA